MDHEPMSVRLKKLRKHLKLTQDEFGKRLKIKRNTIANYEIGRNEPIDGVLYSICREFNVNEAWLKTGAGGDAAMLIKSGSASIDDIASKYGLDAVSCGWLQIFLEQPITRRYMITTFIYGFAKAVADGASSFQEMLDSESYKIMSKLLMHPETRKNILSAIENDPSFLDCFKVVHDEQEKKDGYIEIPIDFLHKVAPDRNWQAESEIDFFTNERENLKEQADTQEQFDKTHNIGKKKEM